jgi:hypothetical protein
MTDIIRINGKTSDIEIHHPFNKEYAEFTFDKRGDLWRFLECNAVKLFEKSIDDQLQIAGYKIIKDI